MTTPPVPELLLIAGRGVYPLLLAESARRQGVRRLAVIAFRGETERRIERWATETHWVRVGQLDRFLSLAKAIGVPHAVMAGQLAPRNLFLVRMDRAAMTLLARLPQRNAHTIFGAVADELRSVGVELLPASLFMEDAMPAPGVLTTRAPNPAEMEDVRLGLRVAKAVSGLEIGQTVVIKAGTILAVEAFEGTDATLRRAGQLGGPGTVVVKVAKQGHDMRFDIPVIGRRTLALLRRIKAAVLAVEAGRTILLEREALQREADRHGIALVAVRTNGEEKTGTTAS